MSAWFYAATELLPTLRRQLPDGVTIDGVKRVNSRTVKLTVNGAPVEGKCEPRLSRMGRLVAWLWDPDHVQLIDTGLETP